jgi:hypothetical protein
MVGGFTPKCSSTLRVSQRADGQRGQQNPLDRFDTVRGTGFPGPHQPHVQGSELPNLRGRLGGRCKGHGCPGQHDLGVAGRMTLARWHMDGVGAARLNRQTPRIVQYRMGLRWGGLGSIRLPQEHPIMISSHDKQLVLPTTLGHILKDVATPVTHMHPDRTRRRLPHRPRRNLPHPPFSRPRPMRAGRGLGFAQYHLGVGQAQDAARVGDYRQRTRQLNASKL